jgi:hypothetical protein
VAFSLAFKDVENIQTNGSKTRIDPKVSKARAITFPIKRWYFKLWRREMRVVAAFVDLAVLTDSVAIAILLTSF